MTSTEADLRQRVRELEAQVAELTAANEALRAGEEEFRLVIEAMPQIVWIARPDGWHTHFNQNWMDFTGLTLAESLGHGWNPPFHPEDRVRAAAQWEKATRTGERYEIEYRLRRKDGTYHWMLGRAMPMRDASGEIVKWFGTCTDIEGVKQAQARLRAQARLLDLAQDSIVVLDLDHQVQHWNQGAQRIHGWTAAEAVGRPIEDLISPDQEQVNTALKVLLEAGEWSGDLTCIDRSGREVLMEGRWTLLRHDDGAPRAVLAVNTDVTERKAMEAQILRVLEKKATHDPLTGLANRALLFDRLELLLGQRQGAGVAVAFLDLDGFKPINDQHGHRTGDQVLVEVAERLRATVRNGDVVARIGGDEFVVVGEADDADTALGMGERLAAAVSGMTEISGAVVRVSASVGVAYVGRDDDSGADDILSRADAVMYEVKKRLPGSAGIEGSSVRGAEPALD
ncbi:MAG: diguanylate cyclase domain-containing protein [Nocardioides sp.]